jgi:hypothetical protein
MKEVYNTMKRVLIFVKQLPKEEDGDHYYLQVVFFTSSMLSKLVVKYCRTNRNTPSGIQWNGAFSSSVVPSDSSSSKRSSKLSCSKVVGCTLREEKTKEGRYFDF